MKICQYCGVQLGEMVHACDPNDVERYVARQMGHQEPPPATESAPDMDLDAVPVANSRAYELATALLVEAIHAHSTVAVARIWDGDRKQFCVVVVATETMATDAIVKAAEAFIHTGSGVVQ